VRRAVAIQMLIDKELGLNFCEDPWRGSFIVYELTDLVEEAVYQEFERISERGGVLDEREMMRSSAAEKDQQAANVEAFRAMHANEARPRLKTWQQVARERKNTFDALMQAGRVGQPGVHVTRAV
jgi:methylmalonyl-CoA mutase